MAKSTRSATKTTAPAPRAAAKAPATPAQAPAAQVESKHTSKASSATARAVTHEQIAAAAFERWQRVGGDSMSNWLAAERELRGV
ncbi:MAG: DUF2934 domain-containing protein [Phycisphaerales bacterium]